MAIITTKYEIGDVVYFINGNALSKRSILRIEISGTIRENNEDNTSNVYYSFEADDEWSGINEEYVFSTKEELIEKLFSTLENDN